jgi:dTDP-glucose pyrophosphorylase
LAILAAGDRGEGYPGQAVILCGGVGSRLGRLTKSTPKPLLPIAGQPFLEILIEEVARHGVGRILLLSAYHAGQVRKFAAEIQARSILPVQIDVAVEPDQAGTGGAIWHARDMLEDVFYLLNGDSLFDAPILDLGLLIARRQEAIGALMLRRMHATDRYGVVEMNADKIIAFKSTSETDESTLINGGIYCFRRGLIDWLSPKCSLENDALPDIAHAGRLFGKIHEGNFIDIGVPADYIRAQTEIKNARERPAVIFILTGDETAWENVPTAEPGGSAIARLCEAVRAANDGGAYAFGAFGTTDKLMPSSEPGMRRRFARQLSAIGAHFDDERTFRRPSKEHIEDDESPPTLTLAGAIDELLSRWPVDTKGILLIGDGSAELISDRAVSLAQILPATDDVKRRVMEWLQERQDGRP